MVITFFYLQRLAMYQVSHRFSWSNNFLQVILKIYNDNLFTSLVFPHVAPYLVIIYIFFYILLKYLRFPFLRAFEILVKGVSLPFVYLQQYSMWGKFSLKSFIWYLYACLIDRLRYVPHEIDGQNLWKIERLAPWLYYLLFSISTCEK